MNPKISIITVTFNAEKVLPITLDSIRNQNYNNIEYIVVDGASKDGTLDEIKSNLDIITKWISEPDDGLYFAMNKGLKIATGDYVWFLNAGDSINDKNILNYLFDKESTLRDVYYGDTLIVDENGNKLGRRRLQPPPDLTWKSFRWGMLVCHQSVLVKRTIAPEFNTKYRIAADYEWVLESLRRARYILGTRQNISAFLRGGFSSNNYLKANKERFKIMTKYYGYFPAVFYNILMLFRFSFTVIRLGRI